MALSVPHPRPPADRRAAPDTARRRVPRQWDAAAAGLWDPAAVRCWYENGLGWAVAPGPDVRLVTGLRFDVLEMPAQAGFAALRQLGPKAPVALHGETMRLLVAAGSADELPGLLDWLEWGDIPLDLRAIGAGGLIDAPTPPGAVGPSGAAVWLRPPEPGHEVERTLPSLTALPALAPSTALAADGSGTDPHSGSAAGSDLVRLVDTAATACHRVRLRRASSQPLALS
ncbi:SCO3374 family protein [Streptomyces flavofungini]|uniref:SCO3374 family protein n=1 Tax=Streptomyces flavofungini TaxID=68200 RepID=UPI0025B1DB67|nr:SCO3374 family protein [Streptomyces flavofungini]WJV47039.1 SCO3374 family protein [Streptomyces flavofungini]